MIIGIVVLWAGYTIALWGYTTTRGFCIGFRDLLNPNYPKSKSQQKAAATATATTAAPAVSALA